VPGVRVALARSPGRFVPTATLVVRMPFPSAPGRFVPPVRLVEVVLARAPGTVVPVVPSIAVTPRGAPGLVVVAPVRVTRAALIAEQAGELTQPPGPTAERPERSPSS
jgi:hypothetical protein